MYVLLQKKKKKKIAISSKFALTILNKFGSSVTCKGSSQNVSFGLGVGE